MRAFIIGDHSQFEIQHLGHTAAQGLVRRTLTIEVDDEAAAAITDFVFVLMETSTDGKDQAAMTDQRNESRP